MFDLHAHILPGIDDGAKTREQSLEMSRAAVKFGTKAVLATPHRKDVTENWSVDHLNRLIDSMNSQNQEHGVDLSLLLGMENHLSQDLPDEIEAGRALTMNGSRYILVEMPFFGRPDWIEDTLSGIQELGLTPVLAHPERIEAFQQDPDLLAMFIERGMLSQITAGSVVGTWGYRVKRFTHELLRNRMAHVIASDTHAPSGRRSPNLGIGSEVAARLAGLHAANAMVIDTPKAILENRPVETEIPRRLEKVK